VADLEGASRPPPLGDGLTPSLTVGRSTVKRGTGTQNIQNDCHQWLWLSDTFLECTKFVFSRGSATDLTGELTALPRLSGLRGTTSKGREGEGEGKGRGKEGKGPSPPFRKFLDPPLNNESEQSEVAKRFPTNSATSCQLFNR